MNSRIHAASSTLARRWLAVSLLAAGAAGCGGSGGGDDDGPAAPAPPPASSGFQPSSTYAAQCVSPRPADAVDPLTGDKYGDRAGSSTTEKNWVRSWIDETYLWYAEVPDLAASAYPTAVDYFDVLKTPAITASGKPKDAYHFTYATADWVALSQSGVELGYGMQFAAISTTPPRRFVVAYTDPGTPATDNHIARGAELVTVDGVDFVNGDTAEDVDTLNAAIFPTSTSPSHTFVIRDAGAASTRTVTMTPEAITHTPVQDVETLETETGDVGYMLFNDHLATSEAALIAAIDQIKASGAGDLVLDIRYNGGGYLDIASELAYMIAGPSQTAGEVFEKEAFNDKNPFDFSDADVTTPFLDTTQGFSTTSGQALPQLGLGRVFVLTTGDTCSASEAIINGLRGVGVEVIQVGSTTCGKPYGFFPTDNCSTTYFSIQFKGTNALGYGDYADGFVPGGSGDSGVEGCAAEDDFDHALGDPAETQLATALAYRANGSCPAASSRPSPSAWHAPGAPASRPSLIRSALRENRFYRSNEKPLARR